MSRWILAAGILGCLVLVYAAWAAFRVTTGVQTRNAFANPRDYPSALLGEPAPAFRLQGSSNVPIQLEDYKGQTVLLSFWSSF
jgi:cytochrome oxidase Cu insertion factor (SCO1/SenC/PrrC family)